MVQKINQDEAMRHEAQQREMYLQNELAINEERYNQGMEKGKQSEKIEIAKKLLKTNLLLEQISTVTDLTTEEIEKLR